MTLGAALNAAVSGLQAQSAQVSAVSENIANASTTAYKIRDIAFQSLVVGDVSGSASGAVSGGVLFSARQNITEQGLIQNTGVTTNIAINGAGFFITAEDPLAQPAELVYTRNGDFRTDENGLLVNNEGQILFGQRTDENGQVIAPNNTSLNSLEPIDVGTISSTTQTTTQVEFDINLPADNPLPATLAVNTTVNNAAAGAPVFINERFDPPVAVGADYDALTDGGASQDFAFITTTLTDGGTNAGDATLITDLDGASFNNFDVGDEIEFDLTTADGTVNTVTIGPITATTTVGDLVTEISNDPELSASYDSTTGQLSISTLNSDDTSSFVTAFEIVDERGVSFTVQQTWERVGVDEYRVTYANPVVTADLNDPNVTNPRTAGIDVDPLGTAADYTDATTIAATVQTAQVVRFNSNGSVAEIANVIPGAALAFNPAAPVEVEFGNFAAAGSGSAPITVELDYGTQGLFDGLTLFSSNASVPEIEIQNIDQDGVRFGSLAGVEIDRDGIVTALFDNGVRRPIFQIPIATFPNPAGLTNVEGTIYDENENAGNLNLVRPGQGNAGTIQPTSIESSTTDTADEFNKLIVSQQAYSSAAQVVSTTDELFDTLIRSVQ